MLGRTQELKLQFQQLADGLLLIIAFWGAHTLRSLGAEWPGIVPPIPPLSSFQWLFAFLPIAPLFLQLQGFYGHPLHKSLSKSLSQIARAAFWLGLLIATCSFFLRLQVPSRAVMPLFAILGTALLLIRERITVAHFRARAKTEALREPVILAGTQDDVQQLRKNFTPEQVLELEVMEEYFVDQQPTSDLVAAIHKHAVSRVIFAGSHSPLNRLQEAIAACELEGVEAWLIADFIRTSIARPTFDIFASRPMLVFRTTPDISWALMVKGFMDRVGALFGLVLGAPIFAMVAIGIKITSPGPIFYKQLRGGINGRPFSMFKFRSMNVNAEQQHAQLASLNQMSGPVFKLENDPRITRFGKFLRKTSLDELPQLLNVLRGEMSLVGPRPLPLYEVEKFESTAQRRRLSMKPGLTCLWQISGRNNVHSFDQWVRLDLQYIDNWSLLLDVTILLRTIPVVIFGLGAR